MARSVIERRIGGELVRLEGTIGVLEALAEAEPEIIIALASIQRGHYHLTRRVVREGAKAAGFPAQKVDAWLDAKIEDCGIGPFSTMAFELLTDLFKRADEAAKKDDAAVETGTETVGS